MRALRVGINSLEKKVDQGFGNLRTEFKKEVSETNRRLGNLEGEVGAVKEVLNEIKKDFISEQKETNQLLKKLIEK